MTALLSPAQLHPPLCCPQSNKGRPGTSAVTSLLTHGGAGSYVLQEYLGTRPEQSTI